MACGRTYTLVELCADEEEDEDEEDDEHQKQKQKETTQESLDL